MKETQHILKSLTPSSLVIIDELCRGTCAEEGTSIAWAICEELLKSDAFTFFTTHFTYLTRLQDLYFNVVNRHTTVKKEVIPNAESMQERLIYQHKVELGTTDIEYYGLALAAKTNLPPDTVKLAVELAELIAETRKVREITTPQRSDEQILYNLNADLRLQSRRNEHSDERNALIIRKFKEDNPQLIERLRIQNSKDNIRTDNTTHNSSIPSWTLLSQPAFNAVAINTINNNEPNLIQNKISEIKNGLENETTTNSPNDIRNFTSVKSSNELLNTVITNDDNYLKNQHSQNNSKRSTPVEDTKTSSMELDKERSENEQENNSIHKMSNIINNDNVNDVAMSENYANELNNTEDSIQITNSDDSDIAEALTQVLKEDSVEITFSKSDSDGMSVDEELLRETVDEINEEFFNNISIDNIVLTPPKEFCDL